MQINQGLSSSPRHQNNSKGRQKKKVIQAKKIAFNPDFVLRHQFNSLSPCEGRKQQENGIQEKMQQLTSPQGAPSYPQQLIMENWTFLSAESGKGAVLPERVSEGGKVQHFKISQQESEQDNNFSSAQPLDLLLQQRQNRVDSFAQNEKQSECMAQTRKVSMQRQDYTPTTATSSQKYHNIFSQGSVQTDTETMDPSTGQQISQRRQLSNRLVFKPQSFQSQAPVSVTSNNNIQKSQSSSPSGRNDQEFQRLQKEEEQRDLLEQLNKQILEKRLKESNVKAYEEVTDYNSFTPTDGKRYIESQGTIFVGTPLSNFNSMGGLDQGSTSQPTTANHPKKSKFSNEHVIGKRNLEVLEEEMSVEQQSISKINSKQKNSFVEEAKNKDNGIPNQKVQGTMSMKESKTDLQMPHQKDTNLEIKRLQSLVESLVEEQNHLKQRISEHEVIIDKEKDKKNSGSLANKSEGKSILASNSNTDRDSSSLNRDSSREFKIRKGKKQNSNSNRKTSVIPEIIFDPNQKDRNDEYTKDILSKNVVLTHQINIKKVNINTVDKPSNQRYGQKQQRLLFLDRNEQGNVQNHLIKYGHSQSNPKASKKQNKPNLEPINDLEYQKFVKSYQTIDQIRELQPHHSNVTRSIDTFQFQKGAHTQKGQVFPLYTESNTQDKQLYQSAKFLPEIKNVKFNSESREPQQRYEQINMQSNFQNYEKLTQENSQRNSSFKKQQPKELENISSMVMPESMVVYQDTFRPNQNNLFAQLSPTSADRGEEFLKGNTLNSTQGSKMLAKINPIAYQNKEPSSVRKCNQNVSKALADRITFSNFNKDGTYELSKMEQSSSNFRKANPYASQSNSPHFQSIMVKRSQAKLQPLSNTNKKGLIPVGLKKFPRDFFPSNER